MNMTEHAAMRRFLRWLLATLDNSTERLADVLWGPRPLRHKPAPLLNRLAFV
jgi:hypothetical protein